MEFEFEQLPSFPVQPEEETEKEIFQPQWNCFCCRDTGIVQPDLVRHVIPTYNYDKDRIPMCQNCNQGQARWGHLNELGVIDQRLTFRICKKLDIMSREDWKQTVSAWFEMARQRVESATIEIAQVHNLRKRDRTLSEFIYANEKHGLKRGDWEEIKEDEEEEVTEV